MSSQRAPQSRLAPRGVSGPGQQGAMCWRWHVRSNLPPLCSSLAPAAFAAQLWESVRAERDMSRIVLYTTPFCGYCQAAKRLLRDKALDFDEIDVAFDEAKRIEMME